MDVIDEGKANRHVAVTSESLSYSKCIVTQVGHVDKDRTDIFFLCDKNHPKTPNKTSQ